MIVVSIVLWLMLLGSLLYGRYQRHRQRKTDRLAADEFAKRVRYIRFLETVEPKKCERCNHKKRLRGVLTLARLCVDCQLDLGLRNQY